MLPASASNQNYDSALGLPDEEDEEIEDFYRVPLRSHNNKSNSVSSFADFVSAPGRSRRARGSSVQYPAKQGPKIGDTSIPEDDVLFDEDEVTYAGSSRGHSKMSTDDSATNVDTDEEQNKTDSSDSGRLTNGKLRD